MSAEEITIVLTYAISSGALLGFIVGLLFFFLKKRNIR